MEFCSVYIPVGVPTYHLETAQDQFERSCAMLRSVDPASCAASSTESALTWSSSRT